MKIIVDAFGGDAAPKVPLLAAAAAKKELSVDIALAGNKALLERAAKELSVSLAGIEIIDAQTALTMEDEATDVLKAKADSSMAVGLKALAQGQGDAFVSAGNTGALLVGATGFVKRMKGVKRAAIATQLPGEKQSWLLLDCGANVEVRPEMLQQFGVLGSAYMQQMAGRQNPKVALASNGTEATKGTPVLQEAYQLLSQTQGIQFVGNIEGRDILTGDADVVVADGFTGNMILKTIEGSAAFMNKSLKEAFLQSATTKIAALLMKGALSSFKKKMDYTEYGGAPLLGIAKPVIKAHGSSNEKALVSAIRQAVAFATGGSAAAIEKALGQSEWEETKTETDTEEQQKA